MRIKTIFLLTLFITTTVLAPNITFAQAIPSDITVSDCHIYMDGRGIQALQPGYIYSAITLKNNGSKQPVTVILAYYENNLLHDTRIITEFLDNGREQTILTDYLPLSDVPDNSVLTLYLLSGENCIYTKPFYPSSAHQQSIFQSNTAYIIQSRISNKCLYDNGSEIIQKAFIDSPGYQWHFEQDGKNIKIRNITTGNYLSVETSGKVTALTNPPSDLQSQWSFTRINDSIFSIKNLFTSCYLDMNPATDDLQCSLTGLISEYDLWQGHWIVSDTILPTKSNAIDPPKDLSSKTELSVLSPEYCSEIQGDTEIQLYSPDTQFITATSWLPAGRYGRAGTIAVAPVDKNGYCSFVFHGDDFPHGPVTLTLKGTPDSEEGAYYLQLYNTGGISWNEGLNTASIPLQATGLSLLYEDDFDNPSLSIGKGNEKRRYTSHTPSAINFSAYTFADYKSPQNPFTQMDTFLRIRADREKQSNGLICSVNESYTGFAIKMPCYFESRFIAQNTSKTWPSFFLMSVEKNALTQQEIFDEVDIMDARGHDSYDIPYSVSYHNWGSEQGLHIDESIPMEDTGRGTWYTNPHTYGVLLKEDYITYYCDNIEVWRCKTSDVSKQAYYYFILDLAIGGCNCGPNYLTRYNGKADMYVDWVRVYGLQENVL